MSDDLRVVHVCRQFKPGIGGLESALDALSREQAKTGMRVRVVTLNRLFGADHHLLPTHETIDGVEIARIPYTGSRRYPIAPRVLDHIRDADIVHVLGVDFFFDFLAWTKPLHGKPLVASTHGGFFHTDFASAFKKLYFDTATRASTRAYGFLAASSGADARTFARLRRRGVGTIENGVDVLKFAGSVHHPEIKRLIYFGRLAPHKRIDRLMPFLASLRARDGDWRLVVAGAPAGVQPIEIERAAQAADVADAVEIIDAPSDERLRALIGDSGAFVSASDFEGFGIAAIEALSAGLLPCLSDIAAHRETVARTGCGALVDFGDADEAAGRFLTARTDWLGDTLRCARVQAGAALYDWGAVAARFDDLYHTVLGRRRRAILGCVSPSRILTTRCARPTRASQPGSRRGSPSSTPILRPSPRATHRLRRRCVSSRCSTTASASISRALCFTADPSART
jgi:alpha-1,3-mannosyltransferase